MEQLFRSGKRHRHGLKVNHFLPAGDLPEIFTHHFPDHGGVKIAGNYQGGIVGNIIGRMEFLYILNRRIEQILHLPDDLPTVWMPRRIEIFVHHISAVAVRPVVIVLPLLILNHILLVGKSFTGYGVGEITHPVGFHPQNHFHGIFGNHFIIYCSVFIGSAIQGASRILDLMKKLVLGNILRLLEHHVLKKMGKSRLSGFFPVRSHMVLNGYGNDRITPVHMKDHIQPVSQGIFFIRNCKFLSGSDLTGCQKHGSR